MNNNLRADFEKWYHDKFGIEYDVLAMLWQEKINDYSTHSLHLSWEAFQAGAALNAVSVASGYVLVPIEPDEDMVEAIWQRHKINDGTNDVYEGKVKSFIRVDYKAMIRFSINAATRADVKGEV